MRGQEDELKQLLLGAELDLLDRVEERCADLEARVGDDASLRGSLHGIIVDVLREAGVSDYERLATVLAPIVVASIRNEIKNSRDQMVDALYPITGKLVAAAVGNAFRELMETLNEKMDQSFSTDRWKARLKAKITGRSEAEILLQQNPPLKIDELLVIHRPTGLLIARAGDADPDEGADRELVSGMITAIMSFSRDAFGSADESDLKSLAFGESQLFLRTSPAVILAIRARGLPPKQFGTALDHLFRSFLDQWGTTLSNFDGRSDAQESSALQTDLTTRFSDFLAAKEQDFRTKSRKGLVAGVAVAACLVLWVGYGIYEGWRVSGIEETGRRIVSLQDGLAGYPVAVRYDDGSNLLLIEGLVPRGFSNDRLETELKRALPDVTPSIKVSAPSLGAVARAQALESRISDMNKRIDALSKNLQRQSDSTTSVRSDMRRSLSDLEKSTGALNQRVRQLAETYQETTPQQLGELDRRTKELSGITAGISQSANETADAFRLRVAKLNARLSALDVKPSPVRLLKNWTDTNAIFFTQDNEFRDPASASVKLRSLAGLVTGASPGVRLIAIGYTDPSGRLEANRQISQRRAEYIIAELKKLGVPDGRLFAIGRANEKLLSLRTGNDSENRRVEFEVIQIHSPATQDERK